MTDRPLRDAVEGLTRRVRELEDREEIARLISGYGPSVDSGAGAHTASLWTATGTYAYELGPELRTLRGPDAVADMVLGEQHQSIIADGCGHLLTSPAIELDPDGSRAVAVGHSLLVRHDPDSGRFYIDRLAANRWLLRRTDAGWRVEERVNRLLDGDSAARELLEPTRPPSTTPSECS